MDRTSIITRLHMIEPELRARGVDALYLFGSHARGEARPDSDVDLFADTAADIFSLDRFAEAYDLLEAALPGLEIGFSSRDAIAPAYREGIVRNAVRIF